MQSIQVPIQVKDQKFVNEACSSETTSVFDANIFVNKVHVAASQGFFESALASAEVSIGGWPKFFVMNIPMLAIASGVSIVLTGSASPAVRIYSHLLGGVGILALSGAACGLYNRVVLLQKQPEKITYIRFGL